MWIHIPDGRLLNLQHAREIKDVRTHGGQDDGDHAVVVTWADGLSQTLEEGERAVPLFEGIVQGFDRKLPFTNLRNVR